MVADDILLELVRAALGSWPVEGGLEGVSARAWQKVIAMSFRQGVGVVAADGYHKIVSCVPGMKTALDSKEMEDLRYEWFGSVLQVESEYGARWKTAVELTDIFAASGIRSYVLKGFSFARLYPVPEHRECGDFDVWLGGDWERGNRLMEDYGVKVSRKDYKDSSFRYKGLHVENHRFCTPIRGSRRRKEYERYLLSIMSEGEVRLRDTQMWSPGPLFNALFVTSHAMNHFVNEGGITLRHILDWKLVTEELHRVCGEAGMSVYEEKCREFGLWKFACAMRDKDSRLVSEILHPTVPRVEFAHGWKTRWQLLRAMAGARWKYRLYTDTNFTSELFRSLMAFVFERHPELSSPAASRQGRKS